MHSSPLSLRAPAVRRFLAGGALLAIGAGCGDSTSPPIGADFLGGTSDNHQIGLVVNSTGKGLTLFQVGSPTTQRQIAFGTSSTVTPTGFSVGGRRAAVPLGNVGSVALVDLETQTIARYYTFATGNATGSAFLDDTTIFAANTSTNVLGKMTVGQASDAITSTVPVCPAPTAVAVSAGRVMVTCSNLDENYSPAGNGLVTIVDGKTLTVLGTVTTGGTNSTDAAVGPDGLLYVLNTGDFVSQGSLTIVDPATLTVRATIEGMGVAPGSIAIDKNGLAYISSYATGTIVWNTTTSTFVRGPDNPVCAKIAASGNCRGAFAATTAVDGSIYQAFFGSPAESLSPYLFVYAPNTFALRDSVAVGSGPAAIQIHTF